MYVIVILRWISLSARKCAMDLSYTYGISVRNSAMVLSLDLHEIIYISAMNLPLSMGRHDFISYATWGDGATLLRVHRV